jgi:predicted ferric reductase
VKQNWTKYIVYGLIVLSLAPFLWLAGQGELFQSNRHAIANTIGLMGSVLLVWQFVLRNRAVSHLFGDDYLALNQVHKMVGIWGVLLIFIHPFLEKLEHSDSLFYTFALNFSSNAGEFEQRVSFGRLAFMVLLLTWVLSVFLRKILPYRAWRRLHLLVYLILPLVMLHAPFIGTFLSNYQWVKVYWWTAMAVWAGLVLWRLLMYLNVGKTRYRLDRMLTLPGGITRYSFVPKGKKLTPKPGQFIYIRGFFFSESHPFSVMEFDHKTGAITCAIKQVGRYTRQLEKIPLNATVYIDGPYGVFTREGQNKGPKVIIASGIGITPFVELVKRFHGKDTYLMYANRTLEVAVNRKEFIRELKENYIDVISRANIVNKPAIRGHIDKAVLLKSLPKNSFVSSEFFICGPPSFMASMQKNLRGLGVDKARIHSEEFSL